MVFHNEIELKSLLEREDIPIDAKKIITNSISNVSQMIQKLQEDETKYRSLFIESPIALMEFDLSDTINYLNQLKIRNTLDFERLLEKNPNEIVILGKKLKLIRMNEASLHLFQIDAKEKWSLKKIGQPQKGHPHYVEILKRVLFCDKALSFFLFSDKNEIYLHTVPKRELIFVISKFMFLPPQKLFGSFIDVTPLKEAENKIRYSEEKLRSIIVHSKDGIILLDETGRIIEWNAAMVQLTDISSANAIGEYFWDIYRPLLPGHLTTSRAINLIFSRFKEVLKTGKAPWIMRPIETEIRAKGTFEFVQLNLFPIKTQKGFMIGGIWRNISQQKQLETKMKEKLLKYKTEDGQIYLIKEAEALLSREVFTELLRIGYFGLVISRTPEKEYNKILNGEYKFIWMAETVLEDQHASLFEQVESRLETLPPKSVVLFDQLSFLIVKYGFKETLQSIFKLREIAILLGITIIFSIDEEIVTDDQLRLLEKESKELETRGFANIPQSLLDILEYIYKNNNLGKRPSITDIVNDLGISRPTIRKRVNQLTAIGHLRETEIGRRKVLEMTQKGFNLFSLKESE